MRIITAKEAAQKIKSGSTVVFNGFFKGAADALFVGADTKVESNFA